ncbi:MAG TPA: hypothetical protein VFI03_11410 [Solirubrobacterales bacterium]|nr:hypothetical protein [Solirubrobacterales bacterium]
MPTAFSIAKRVPWMKVWAAAVWLTAKGRAHLNDNLTESERDELRGLVVRSKGRPGNLSQRDRDRVKAIVKKAAIGR